MTDEPKPEHDITQKLKCETCGFKDTEACKDIQRSPMCGKYIGGEQTADEKLNAGTFKCLIPSGSNQGPSIENKVRQYQKCDECPFKGNEKVCEEASRLHEWCRKYQQPQGPAA